MSTDRYAEWVARKFEGLERAELKEAAEVFGLTFGPNTSERTMRVKLCEKAGTLPVEEGQANVTPIASRGVFDPKPNLTSTGKWGGRRHYVTIFPQGAENENSPKYVRLFHETEPRDYPFNTKIDLPEPLYHSLKLAESGRLDERELRDSSGQLVRIEHFEVKAPRFPHQYHGIVPGTEDLPGSLKEYWQRQAEKTNNFSGIQRRQLIAVRADLYGPVGPAFYKDLTDQDILASIVEFLGLDLAEAA